MARQCSDCRHLRRTSPEQVFLKCEFWSARRPPVNGAFSVAGHDYVLTHCHMQPEAPACPYFAQKEVVA